MGLIVGFVISKWRYLLVAIISSAASFYIQSSWFGNLLPGDSSKVPVVVGVDRETESGSQHVHTEVTVTKNVRPDGSSTKVTKTVTDDTSKSSAVSVVTKPVPVPAAAKRAVYQVDVTTDPFEYKNAKVGVGARIGNLPAFGVVEYEIKDKTVRAGVRVEW